MPEKRPAVGAALAGIAKRLHVEDPAEPPAAPLMYRCTDCLEVVALDESAAMLCRSCAWRILIKETRAELRIYGTD